jgi:hypothetical protein
MPIESVSWTSGNAPTSTPQVVVEYRATPPLDGSVPYGGFHGFADADPIGSAIIVPSAPPSGDIAAGDGITDVTWQVGD